MNYIKAILIEKRELKSQFEQTSVRKENANSVKVTVKSFGFKENKSQSFSLVTINEVEYIVVLENTYLWDLIKNTGNFSEEQDSKEENSFNLNDVF